jgi:ABC-type transporter Mla subunit MlaD
MNENARYVRLGAFVLAAAAMLVAGVGILGSGLFKREPVLAETYFDESVQGLAEGSPVKARGVTVGRVEEIGFAFVTYGFNLGHASQEKMVRVVLSLDDRRMPMSPERFQRLIADGMRIRVAMAGITGGAYLEIDMVDPARFPVASVPWTPVHLHIPSCPSTGRQLLDSVDKLLTQLEAAQLDKVGGDLRTLLTSLTRSIDGELTPALRELRGTVTKLPGTQDRLDRLLESIDRLAAQALQALDRDVHPAVEALTGAVKEAGPVVRDAGRVVRRADLLLAGRTETLSEILDNLRAATDELRQLSGQLRRNPGGVLLADPPPQREEK